MDEFGESFESDSSFDSEMDLGGSESFESFDTSDMSFTESESFSEGFDDVPLEDFSSSGEDLALNDVPALDDYSSDMEELPFDEATPLEDPDIVPNDISEEMDTLDAVEEDPSAMLDQAPEEDMSYFEDASLEDPAVSETTDFTEEVPLDETVPESEVMPETSDSFEELPFDEAEAVPEAEEISESSDSFEELPFDEAETVPEMPETPEVTDEPESLPFDETPEAEVFEPAENDGGLDTNDYETAPETLDNVDPESTGELAPSDNPYSDAWEQFSEEVNEGDTQPADWDSLQDVPFAGEDTPENIVENKPYESLAEYMSDHNYGPGDFETYSQDAEWRELMRNEYPDYELPELSQESAQEQLNQYMSDHNYGIEDYDEYSQDPIWRDLHSTVYPDNELPPLNEEATEAVEPSFEDPTNIETPEVFEDAPENIPEMAEEVPEVPEVEEPAERVYDDFETMVMEDDPEFYDSGEFLVQGINEYGYEGTCGETTQANTLNQLLGTNEFTENKVLDVAVENGLCETGDDPAACGGTTTEQFMDLYDKMNEQLDGAISTELYEYDDALGVEDVAKELEDGKVINVAVDSNALWGNDEYVDAMGVPVDDIASDHWITVTGVERNDLGEIEGFNILDSGGGEDFVSAEKYHDICFGTDEHKVLDPTTIVVSKAEDVNG